MSIDEVKTLDEHDAVVLLVTSRLRVCGHVTVPLRGTKETAVLWDVSPDLATFAFAIKFVSPDGWTALPIIDNACDAVRDFLRLVGYSDVIAALT